MAKENSNFKIDLPIDQLVGGGVMEKLNAEFEKVFENIHDPNMKTDIKRVVTAKFGFTPDQEKEIISLEIDFATKLADVEGLTTKIVTDKDLKTNTIAAQEFMSSQRGQTFIDDNGDLKTDTGEPVDVIEEEMKVKNKIRHLRRGNE